MEEAMWQSVAVLLCNYCWCVACDGVFGNQVGPGMQGIPGPAS